ncbi:MAG TPA: pyridoxal-dependent decarboxylase [Ktedonobacteraceae bacterium]|nr:pyridoxal-dependent decarboxylase [Ktedonobacteraceae bacterium]
MVDTTNALDKAQQGMSGDMSPEDFRRYGHQVIDWLADYFEHPRTYPVLSQAKPGDLQRALPSQPPRGPESMTDILGDFERLIIPGLTHWNTPGFLAYISNTGSGPGILGELLASGLNVNAMLWRTSPAATELEQVTLDWLRQMMGLPEPLFGVINDTASSGVLYALAAAREAIPALHIRQKGLGGRDEVPRLRLYISQEAHSSIEKAAITLGIGQEGVRAIRSDDQFRLDVAELAQAIVEDKEAGWLPFAVVATVGTTATTSIDPVPQIADLCEQHGLWLHVDASYGGAAAIVPEMRQVLAGSERADSFIVNPHKWLFTPLDCSVLYTRHQQQLKAAFSLIPEYLNNAQSQSEEVPNLMDYGNALGRRFRSLKLWMIMRYFGQDGLAARIREHCQIAQWLADSIDASPDFERLAPTPFSIVCFRAHPQHISDEEELNRLNETLMQTINNEGHFFLSHSKLRGIFTLRVAIGNIRTTASDIRQLWEDLQAQLQKEYM